MARILDLTGQVFGEWVVVKKALSVPKYDKQGQLSGTTSRWTCRCSCGVERDVITDSLRNGRSTSCGHLAQDKHHSIYKGERFGLLTVLDTYTPEKGMARARCLCACGNSKETTVQALVGGVTKSCGCLRRQSSKQRMKKMYHAHDMVKDEQHRVVSWQPKEKELK